MLDKKKSPTNETQNIGISKVDSSNKLLVCLDQLYQRGSAGMNTAAEILGYKVDGGAV